MARCCPNEAAIVPISSMRHRVSIFSVDAAAGDSEVGVDSDGFPIGLGTLRGGRWASILPLSGRTLFDARQVDGEVTHKITIRFFEGLDSTYRTTKGTRVFEIERALNIDEQRRFHTIMAKERNA